MLFVGAAAGVIAIAGIAVAIATHRSATHSTPGSHPTTTAAAAATPSPASPTATPSKKPVTTINLTGKWSGEYIGSYHGTFRLSWHQTGSHLDGNITISNPSISLPIDGTVSGTSIRFGTVGSAAITYTGTVSGTSMSGTYQVNGSAGGPWHASKI